MDDVVRWIENDLVQDFGFGVASNDTKKVKEALCERYL